MNTLMERPSDEVLKYKAKKFFYGKEMEDYVTNSIYDDWCRFHFVQMDVKDKIEKNKLYKVWFEYHDASDPMDSSCSYRIYYIEEVPIEIENALNSWKKCEKIVKDYLLI